MTRAILAALLLVSGCAAPQSTGGATGGARMEDVRASCMRGHGFQYVPVTPQAPTEEFRKRAAGDYAALLAFRKRYGYMVFSGLVFPDDPAAAGWETGENPNDTYTEKLSPSQGVAYLKADDACYRQAAEQVLHKKIKDQQDLIAQMTQEMDRAERRTLDTDPGLVAMARDYAGCMRGKGYAMPADTPSLIGSAEVKRFWKQRNDLGKLTPQLTPDEARPYLDKEIASALDDLECGKDFFRAYNPRYQAIWDEVSRRWGQG